MVQKPRKRRIISLYRMVRRVSLGFTLAQYLPGNEAIGKFIVMGYLIRQLAADGTA
jgi:hypothetical protein